ncbi:MAG: hypothetical protein WC444_06680 [Candidatus Paceibacterota bacterium]
MTDETFEQAIQMGDDYLQHCPNEIEKLRQELTDLNASIKNLEDRQVLSRNLLAKGDESYANEKLELINQIALEKDGDKPKFSNEVKRNARFQELMATGHPLHTLKAQLEDDKTKLEYSYNELSFLKRKFQVLLLIRGTDVNV